MKTLIFVIAFVLLTLPAFGKKKPKPPILPTQPDIVRGCVSIRNITFERARPFHFNTNTGVSGIITNACGQDAYVFISIDFFNSYRNKIDSANIEKLAKPGDTPFWGSGDDTAITGRVTLVTGHLNP